MGHITLENLDAVFAREPRAHDKQLKCEAINVAAKLLAKAILLNAPDCADRSSALRLVREARMTASAAIALDGLV